LFNKRMDQYGGTTANRGGRGISDHLLR
jgi:hypothetical protein